MLRSKAFTLIELLTVIAIIGILAAIIVPTVGRVRQSARSAQCISNLRQIGMAITLYAEEDKQQYPWGFISTGSIRWSHTIQNHLASQSGKKTPSEIFRCPTESIKLDYNDSDNKRNTNYAGNSRLMWEMKDNRSRRKIGDVVRPSQVILVADGTVDASGGSDWGFFYQAGVDKKDTQAEEVMTNEMEEDAGDGKRISWRHDGKTQVVFVDGHAKAFAVGELKWKNMHHDY
ncbi:DUF1559 domain-containing protein [Opitutaceae bacterium TAV4]|nr:DUF1559 domain-containing protein [Opitutaceae bacterium TAV4]RRK01237.1 DUF1559 domain-containing protein [Opitutaceae bacterium TAV3]